MNNTDTLKKYRAIAYDDLAGTKEYLEQMAREGWMLEKIEGASKFVFKSCEPCEIRYAVEIFTGGSIFDTHVVESNEEYIEYCRSAGWEFVCSAANIDIFRTEDEKAPEIESDPALKLKTIRKACRPQRVIYPFIFTAMGIIYIGTSLTFNRNVTECSFFSFSTILLWVFAGLVHLVNAVSYLGWLIKAEKAVNAGDDIPRHKTMGYEQAVVFIALTGLIHSAFSVWAGTIYCEKAMYMIPVIWIVVILVLFVTHGVSVFAEKKKLSRGTHRLLILVVIPVLWCFLLLNVIFFFVLNFAHDSDHEKGIGAFELVNFGSSGGIVRREDHVTHWGHFLMSMDQYTIEAHNADRVKSMESEDGRYHPADGEEYLPITYTWRFDIYDTKIAAIHDRILREAKEGICYRMLSIRFPFDKAEKIEMPGVSGEIYRCVEYGEYLYLIMDGSRIVFSRCDEELTAGQYNIVMSEVGRQL